MSQCHLVCLMGSQLDELYTLLNENYVEDDDNMFRFDYSREFLRWYDCPHAFVFLWTVPEGFNISFIFLALVLPLLVPSPHVNSCALIRGSGSAVCFVLSSFSASYMRAYKLSLSLWYF